MMCSGLPSARFFTPLPNFRVCLGIRHCKGSLARRSAFAATETKARPNRGDNGSPLTPQQMRNYLYIGEANKLLATVLHSFFRVLGVLVHYVDFE